MSLGAANVCYRALAANAEEPGAQVALLRKALSCVEEAAEIFRAIANARYVAHAVRDCVVCHLELARFGSVERTSVGTLCEEGQALSRQMEDDQRVAFFAQVRQALSQVG